MTPRTIMGTRLPDCDAGGIPAEDVPGSYWRSGGVWHCIPPLDGLHAGSLAAHTVTEHEDGTITVHPSILFHPRPDGSHGWHGWLRQGIWMECD